MTYELCLSRFPYPLQIQEHLRSTLEMHGWRVGKTINRKSIIVYPPDNSRQDGMTLDSVQKMLWEKPHMLFSQYFSEFGEDIFKKALKLPEHVALADDKESSSPEVEGMPHSEREKLLHEMNKLCLSVQLNGGVPSSKQRRRVHALLLQFGWKYEAASWSKKWWKWEKVYMPSYARSKGKTTL